MGLIFTRFRFLHTILLTASLFISIDSIAANISSAQNGNWNDAATWGGTIPAAGDDVVIGTATIVSLDINTPNLASLTVQSGGSLIVGLNNSILNISGNIVNNGTVTFWQTETSQADIILQANSTWTGTGTWNLSDIDLQAFSLEFGSAVALNIYRNIIKAAGSKINSIAKRNDITFIAKGTATLDLPSSSSDYFYGNLTINKTSATVAFENSPSANTINLLGNLTLVNTNDRLYPGEWNTLAINNDLSGNGYIIGTAELKGPSIAIGGTGAAIILNISSAANGGIFRDFKITRPSGVTINSPSIEQVAFRFNFTIDNSTVTIGNNVLLKVGSTVYPSSGNLNLLNGGQFIGGANASFDISGDAALTEIKFDESSQANHTLKSFALTKTSGTCEMKSNLIASNAFNLTNAGSNFSIGPYTLTVNGSITNTGSFKGSSVSNLILGGTTTGGNTFRFLQTNDESRSLQSLSIGRTGSLLYTFNLTNNLNIIDNLTIGGLNRLVINANTTLNVKGNVTGTGDIGGSTTGELVIDNPTAAEINPLRILSGTSFKSFISKRTAGVVLNGSFIVRDVLSLENNSKLTLPANGTLTLGVGGTTPTPGAFTGDGMLAGSSTSNLSIRGSSSLIGLRFSQSGTDNILNNFTIEKSVGSVNLLSTGNLNVTGELIIADNNNLSIGSGTLTLNQLNFNTSGELTGSANSNLAITGTGTTARSIRFNQAAPANRILKTYSQTRNVTITLANRLDIIDRVEVSGAGAILESAGNLTLLSTATTNANIAPLTGGASIAGNVNIESYFTGGGSATRGTRLVSSPINDASVTGDKTFKQMQSYMIITGPGGQGNGFDKGNDRSPNAVTLYKYNEAAGALPQSQFTNITSITEPTIPGNGFLMFYRGDRSSYTTATASTSTKLNTPFAIPENTTMKYTGPINQGDISVNLSFTNISGDEVYNGYNLIGNPYPSVIDWDQVEKTNVDNLVMIIKPQGGYATNMNGIFINSEEMDMQYIQPGQGFYVRANGTNASVIFKESVKAPAIQNPVRLLSSPVKPLLMSKGKMSAARKESSAAPAWKQLRMNLQDEINKEEAVAVFNKGSNASAGMEDAAFFTGSSISLSTLSVDKKSLSINFMPELSEVNELKLNVSASSSKMATLNFTDLAAAEDYQVFLKDNYLNKQVEIKKNTAYNFEINKSDSATYGSERLKLLFVPATTLPIELVSFTAKKSLSGASLEWITASEQNNNYFEIERSNDGRNFTPIGRIKSAGNSVNRLNYAFLDKKPVNGINYYQLKQVDNNGKFTYSKPVYLNFGLDEKNLKLSLYPNPAADEIFIDLIDNSANTIDILVSDSMGKEIIKQTATTTNGQIKQNISKLSSGIYILQIIDAKSNVLIGKTKFIKN